MADISEKGKSRRAGQFSFLCVVKVKEISLLSGKGEGTLITAAARADQICDLLFLLSGEAGGSEKVRLFYGHGKLS